MHLLFPIYLNFTRVDPIGIHCFIQSEQTVANMQVNLFVFYVAYHILDNRIVKHAKHYSLDKKNSFHTGNAKLFHRHGNFKKNSLSTHNTRSARLQNSHLYSIPVFSFKQNNPSLKTTQLSSK